MKYLIALPAGVLITVVVMAMINYGSIMSVGSVGA